MRFLFVFLSIISLPLHADVLLKDIGVIGLMSHDIFAWDHKKEVNTENGRLDLSTIFDWENGSRWEKGGNPKNGENAPVYTITMDLVDFYTSERKSYGDIIARENTVKKFHAMIKESFSRITGLNFPVKGQKGMVTNVEQAALRGLHDILPGRVQLFRGVIFKDFALTNFLLARLRLNDQELNQVIPFFDGDYAPEYQKIRIPFRRGTINLKEIDAAFIEKFSPYRQEDMLRELKEVANGQKALSRVFFMKHIFDLVSKGICSEGNQWMPEDIACE